MERHEFTVSGITEGRADRFLAAALGAKLSRTEIQKVIRERGVLVNGMPVRDPGRLVRENDRVGIEIETPAPAAVRGEDIPLTVVYEDQALLVIDKPAGMVVHPAPGHRSGTLVNALLGSEKKLSRATGASRPGIVHRLDKNTSGLLIIAKTDRAHRALSKMFEGRRIRKNYLALAHGRVEFDRGMMEEPIGRDRLHRTKMAVVSAGEGREAVSEYRVLKRFRAATLLSVRLVTGRTHQIRVHLAHLGHPIFGDFVYGRDPVSGRLGLHAAELVFEHPVTGKEVRCEAPVPEDFRRMIDREEAR